ncbi:MAG: ArgE/DapE family deacylase [Actinomycetia bacterium]|nr:ArgE/DapE family deacylase [Actinomycetes bacterium]
MGDSAQYDLITAAVASRIDELVRLTKEFVSFPTENPPGTELRPCQDWICRQLDELGIPYLVTDSSLSGGEHRIIVATIGDHGPTMYLHGHYDVVPAFSTDQFDPVEVDGSLRGRGTCDMKGGLVAMLIAAVIHRDSGGGGKIRIVFVPDEETGGADGSERLEELGILDATNAVGAIVAEPSFPNIWYAARGAFTVEVTVSGRPAHVGLHYTGVNAFVEAHAAIADLIEYANEVALHRTELRIEPEAARASIMLIGGISGGGTNFNIVPGEFRFTIDRRPNPDEDYDQAKADLIARLDHLASLHPLSYTILQDVDPAFTSPDEALIGSFQRSIEQAGGRHAPLSMCPGCLETRVYSRAGIPAVAYGPGPMDVMHAPDEHVPIANLVEVCAVYAQVLRHHLS